VYVAYPFISTVPTFFNALGKANWWWALLGLVISASTYVGAAARAVGERRRIGEFLAAVDRSGGQHFLPRPTTPAGVGGLAAQHPDPAEERPEHDAGHHPRFALQQSMQVIMHVFVADLLQHRCGARETDLSHFVPRSTMLYLIAGVALGIVGIFLLLPNLRRWLSTSVTPRLKEVITDIIEVAREPKRMSLIVFGCTGTTLGAAFGVVDQRRGVRRPRVVRRRHRGHDGRRKHSRSAAPHSPAAVGAVEAALIGGLAAFGVPAAVSVPSVLLLSGADLLDTGVRRAGR